jgi:hypothetical protein
MCHFLAMEWQGMFGDESEEETVEQEKRDTSLIENPRPICLVQRIEGIGGGRGIFAEADIAPGTLILAEKPVYTWPTDMLFNDPTLLRECVEEICTRPDIYEITQFLHPLTLTDAEPEEINKIQSFWSSIKTSNRPSAHEVSSDELIRVALVLQHNGFTSGLYKYLSLVNHSCLPNCIKFSPSSSSSNKSHWKYLSEIWSVQPIRAGEEITICYIEKVEIPYQTMRNYLLLNHQFLCTCKRCKSDAAEERIGEWRPPLVERTLEALESQGIAFDLKEFILQTEGKDVSDSKFSSESESEAADLVTRGLEIIAHVHTTLTSLTSTTSQEQGREDYNSHDLLYLLCRHHLIIVTIAVKLIDDYYQERFDALQDGEPEQDQHHSSPAREDEQLTQGVIAYLCECYLKHAHELHDLQAQYLPCPDHPLIGETVAHMAQGIKITLSTKSAASILHAIHIADPARYDWAKSITSARRQMRRYEERSSRVQALYKIDYEMLQRHFLAQKIMFE